METNVEANHEFSEADNKLFINFSNRMSLVGKVLVLVGVLFIIGGIFSFEKHYGNILEGLIQIAIGVLTTRASKFFHKIAVTEGNDLDHLRNAIIESTKLYTIQLYFYGFIFFLIFFILISIVWNSLT